MLNPIRLANKNFLSSFDLSTEEIRFILKLAKNFKNKEANKDLRNNKIFDITIRRLERLAKPRTLPGRRPWHVVVF